MTILVPLHVTELAPTLSYLRPNSGVPAYTSVEIIGQHLTQTIGVSFNGSPAFFTVNSATQLTATVPADATSGLVVIKSLVGDSNGIYFQARSTFVKKGMNVDITLATDASYPYPALTSFEQDKEIATCVNMNVEWVRCNIDWPSIQDGNVVNIPVPIDTALVANLGTVLDRAKNAGLKVLLNVTGCPNWANGDANDKWVPPINVQDYATLITYLVNQWSDKIDAVQIWNRENVSTYWKPLPNPAKYVQLLRAGYASVKAVDSSMPVVFGGISLNDYSFLESCYTAANTASLYTSAVLGEPGLVSYWRLGELFGTLAADQTNTNNGTYTGGYTLGQSGSLTGDTNTAVTFNGTTGYVTVPDQNSLDLGDVFTLEAWIKRGTTGDSNGHAIISKGNPAYLLEIHNANQLYLEKQGLVAVVFSTTTITDLNWHHVAATKNGSNVHLYIDGVDVTGSVTNATFANTAQALNIGRRVQANDLYFKGVIDEVAIYSTALSPARILAHYNAGISSATTPATPLSSSFDIMACHPYSNYVPEAVDYTAASTPRRIDKNYFPGYKEVRASMVAQGDDDKSLWLTEFGWSTAPGFVTEAQQADYLKRAYEYITADSYIDVAFWNIIRDQIYGGGNSWEDKLGLLHHNFLYTSYEATVLEDIPISYWRLGELSGTRAADSKGVNTGTYTNSPVLGTPGALPGDPDTAITCNGATNNRYVAIPHNANLNLQNALTIEAWVKPRTAAANGGFYEKTGSGDSVNASHLLYMETGYAQFRTVKGSLLTISSDLPLVVGAWSHVVGTYDGATMRIYVNGVAQGGTAARVAPLDAGIGQARLAILGGLNYPLDGVLDEVAVYSTALSPTRIQRHYDVGRRL